MAKFITTKQITSELESLIKKADERLYIVSPYLKLSKDFRDLLTFRNTNRKDTKIIFGKQELNPEQMTFFQGLRFVYLFFSEDLHAKCYINDTKMIITSMNLYDFSMMNNKEMGILIDKSVAEDNQVYNDAWSEIDFIEKTSKPFDFVSKPAAMQPPSHTPKETRAEQPAAKTETKKSNGKPTGYCIRTGVEIPFNIEKPMSYDAYKAWNKYGDSDYPEKYCHFSGEPSDGKTSVSKPILSKNWKKAKELFNLA
jgi:phosphatidylserine/phosphatidylglycerophosphate/cardiolipin synthase-like enzyme